MTWVVTYDIGDDRIRDRIATVLTGFGERVQWSVFECRLDEREFLELEERLRTALESQASGSIRFYPLCANCIDRASGLGMVRNAAASAAAISD